MVFQVFVQTTYAATVFKETKEMVVVAGFD